MSCIGVPVVAQLKRIWLASMRSQVQSLAVLSGGLRIWRCRELWCSLQMWLGSCVAVAVVQAGPCSSSLTPSLGTSICHLCGPKKTKQNKTKCPTCFLAPDRLLIHDSSHLSFSPSQKQLSNFWRLLRRGRWPYQLIRQCFPSSFLPHKTSGLIPINRRDGLVNPMVSHLGRSPSGLTEIPPLAIKWETSVSQSWEQNTVSSRIIW